MSENLNKKKRRWILKLFGLAFVFVGMMIFGTLRLDGAALAAGGILYPVAGATYNEEIDEEMYGSQQQQTQQEFEDIDLPDLQPLPSTNLAIRFEGGTRNRLLLFSSSFVNRGLGPLEMRGEYETLTEELKVRQVFYGSEETVMEGLEGNFHYSTEHGHFHWGNFAAYEIWTTETSGRLSRAVVVGEKVGFCLYDTEPASSEWREVNLKDVIDIPAQARYRSCGTNRQGLSVGWVDIYEYFLAGQSLNVEHLKDGVYALRTVVDPEGVLYESDTGNNSVVVYFLLEGDHLQVIGEEISVYNLSELLPEERKTDASSMFTAATAKKPAPESY